ncbi:MAG: hypothetical protein JSR77_06895 [Planctomycetes bacterium]|nr:hypothetical protein [Planctomycetota bacterium]
MLWRLMGADGRECSLTITDECCSRSWPSIVQAPLIDRMYTMMKPIFLLTLCGLSLAEPCHSWAVETQPLHRVAPQDRNAALKYWEASVSLSSEIATKLSELNYDQIGTTQEAVKDNAAYQAVAKITADYNPALWIEASHYKKCDFEVKYEAGVMALLSHLGKVRSGARLLRFDARRDLIEGRPEDAATEIAAIVRMGNHVSGDGFLISSLVAVAMGTMATDEARVLAESGKMTAAARDTIRAAIEEVDPKDPMRMRASIVGEQTVMLDWLGAHSSGADAGAKLSELLFALSGNPEDPTEEVHRKMIASLDEKGLAREIEQSREAYAAMLEAWDASDPVEACAAMARRISKGEFGTLALVLCPAVSKVRQTATIFEKTLTECKETLENAKLAAEPESK